MMTRVSVLRTTLLVRRNASHTALEEHACVFLGGILCDAELQLEIVVFFDELLIFFLKNVFLFLQSTKRTDEFPILFRKCFFGAFL
jgi:hypothetical protein